MKRFDLAIFDCDGVLFDSKDSNRAYYNTILKGIDRHPMTEKELNFCHMHTANESIDYLLRFDKEKITKAKEYAAHLDYGQFLKFIRMEPGFKEVLATIRPPLLTAISTNRSTTMPRLVDIFELDKWFDEIVCALDVRHPKPDPEGVLLILDRLNVSREKAIYIGDSMVDEEVASRAGLSFIAYKNAGLNADFYVQSLLELPDILLAWR